MAAGGRCRRAQDVAVTATAQRVGGRREEQPDAVNIVSDIVLAERKVSYRRNCASSTASPESQTTSLPGTESPQPVNHAAILAEKDTTRRVPTIDLPSSTRSRARRRLTDFRLPSADHCLSRSQRWRRVGRAPRARLATVRRLTIAGTVHQAACYRQHNIASRCHQIIDDLIEAHDITSEWTIQKRSNFDDLFELTSNGSYCTLPVEQLVT